tara:strand:+ start:15692 stop:16057 length:366 start_codon:yes stop_codon:yes gene_type:complete
MDIRALAEKGYDIAEGLADQAWKTITLRLDPTEGVYDPITETSTSGWGTEVELSALRYNEKQYNADTSLMVNNEVYLVKASDVGNVDPTTEAQIQIGAATYGVVGIELDPVGATIKFIVAR